MLPSSDTARARRTLQAALLTVLVALGLTAGAADAKVPRSFYGVEGDPVSTVPGLPRRRPTSTGCARPGSGHSGSPSTGPPWSPRRGRRATGATTTRSSSGRHARGSESCAVLVGSPHFAAESAAYAPLTAAGRASFKRFVRDVVRRYGRGGSFWRAHPRCRGGRFPPTRSGTSPTTRPTGRMARRGPATWLTTRRC